VQIPNRKGEDDPGILMDSGNNPRIREEAKKIKRKIVARNYSDIRSEQLL